MFLVPTMYHDLLRADGFDPGRLPSLRSLGAAGMVIRDDLYADDPSGLRPICRSSTSTAARSSTA